MPFERRSYQIYLNCSDVRATRVVGDSGRYVRSAGGYEFVDSKGSGALEACMLS